MKLKKITLFLLFAVLLISINSKISAHPHVFIEYWTDVIFKNGKLAGIRVNWFFDEFFSAMVIRQNDKNKNKKFEPAEIKIVKKRAFDNLKNFGYFTYLRVNRRIERPKWVDIFSARIKQNRLIYSFFVPINAKIKSTQQKLRIKYNDPTIYVAFSPHKNPVRIKNAAKIKTQIKNNKYFQTVVFRR